MITLVYEKDGIQYDHIKCKYPKIFKKFYEAVVVNRPGITVIELRVD